MDAAHNFNKIALFLIATLALAGNGFAATTATLLVSPNSVTIPGSTLAQTVTVTSSGGAGSPLNFTVSGYANGTPCNLGSGFYWFNVNHSNATLSLTTPATLTVGLITANCPNTTGASFTITDTSNTSDPATPVGVTFNNTGGGGGTSGVLTATPNTVTLASSGGSTFTGTTSVSTSSTTPVGFTISATSNCNCLTAVPASGNDQVVSGTPLTLDIYAYAAGLANGLQTGTLTLQPNAGGTATTVNVQFTVGSSGTVTGSLVPTPSTVSLAYPSAQSQSILVTSTTATSFSAIFSSASGMDWLLINGQSNLTGQSVSASGTTLVLSVNTAQLPSSGDTGTLYLYSNVNDFSTVSVSLSVNGSGGNTGAVAAPSSLTFAQTATVSAGYQTILINGTSPTVLFTSNGTLPSSASISYGISGNSVVVTISGGGLTAGNSYTGSITVGSSLGTQTIPVTVKEYSGVILLAFPSTITCQTTQGTCNNNSLSLASSDGTTALPLSVTSSASWVTLSPAGCGTSTPASCTVIINPAGLPNGLNSATITATATSGSQNGSVPIPVVVLVSNSTVTNPLTITDPTGSTVSSLTFTTATSASHTLYVTASSTTTFTAGTQTSNCGNAWLSISPSGTFTVPSQQTFTVTVNPAATSSGSTSCSGSVVFTTANGTQTIPVSLTITSSGAGGNVTVTSGSSAGGSMVTSLSYTAQAGGSQPASQSLYVASAQGSASIPFTVTASSTGSWLSTNLSSNGAATPASFTVSVNAANLTAAGSPYSGTITISPNGGSTVTIPVTLTVTPATSVSATPTTLTFSYTAGGNAPPTQTIQVSGNGGALPFTATATSTGNWLVVSPTSGTTVTSGTVPLTVSVTNLSSLNASSTPYTGTVTVAGSGSATGSSTITVSLTVTAPLPTVISVSNAASSNSGPISAGEIVSIFGTGLGPQTGQSATIPAAGPAPTNVAGVTVTVGGYPAPVLYASATQVNAIVPYEINSPVYLQNPSVIVKYLGQTSNGFARTQAGAAPGLFTANASGSGPGAILNSNLSPNSDSNPATKGSIVVLYLTGEGQTIPAGVTGKVTPVAGPYPQSVQAPVVTIGGQGAQVQFYGEAPTLVSGVFQINVVVPSTLSTSGVVDEPVVVSFGGISSQLTATGAGAVTVAVH